MTIVTPVYGGTSKAREAAIAARVTDGIKTAAIIEGFAGIGVLTDGLAPSTDLQLIHLAAGCLCCTGQLAMRVTLNRLLRNQPDQIYLSLANSEHLTGVINFLKEDQYHRRLKIGKAVDCSIPGTDIAFVPY